MKFEFQIVRLLSLSPFPCPPLIEGKLIARGDDGDPSGESHKDIRLVFGDDVVEKGFFEDGQVKLASRFIKVVDAGIAVGRTSNIFGGSRFFCHSINSMAQGH